MVSEMLQDVKVHTWVRYLKKKKLSTSICKHWLTCKSNCFLLNLSPTCYIDNKCTSARRSQWAGKVSRSLTLLHLLLWQEQRDLVGFPWISGLSEAADQQFAHFTEHQWLLLIGWPLLGNQANRLRPLTWVSTFGWQLERKCMSKRKGRGFLSIIRGATMWPSASGGNQTLLATKITSWRRAQVRGVMDRRRATSDGAA